jgi:hypothetical protein
MTDKSRGVVLGIAGTVLVAAVGGVAVSQTMASEQAAFSAVAASGEITACAHKTSGKMRLLKSGKKCKRTEKALTWNQTGPAGPTGATGATGAPGAPGLSSSVAYQATSMAVVPLGTAKTSVISLPLAGGMYVVNASATIKTTRLDLVPGAKECLLADGSGAAYTSAPLWAVNGAVGVGQTDIANINYAITVPTVPGASVQLMCSWAGGGSETTGVSVITATRVQSIN